MPLTKNVLDLDCKHNKRLWMINEPGEAALWLSTVSETLKQDQYLLPGTIRHLAPRATPRNAFSIWAFLTDAYQLHNAGQR